MHKNITRVAAVAVAAALSAVGASGARAPDTVSRAGQPARHPAVTAVKTAAVPGARLWTQHYNGPGGSYDDPDDIAYSVAVSPGGDRVFVTGQSAGRTSPDYATVAYNTATGAQLWAKRYNGPGNLDDWANSVAVSPSGGTVFVTGASDGGATDMDYATVAYQAATGAQLWVKRYNGPGYGSSASSVAVGPGGGTVFVTGSSYAGGSGGRYLGLEYATVAYRG